MTQGNSIFSLQQPAQTSAHSVDTEPLQQPAKPAPGKRKPQPEIDVHLHDRGLSFEFVVKGKLTANTVHALEQSWLTAQSILADKALSVDLSGLSSVDEEGRRCLTRMTASGAHLKASSPPQSEDLLKSLGVPIIKPTRSKGVWLWYFRRLAE